MGVTLNWATADVEDGKLTVDLEGEVPSGWKKALSDDGQVVGRRQLG